MLSSRTCNRQSGARPTSVRTWRTRDRRGSSDFFRAPPARLPAASPRPTRRRSWPAGSAASCRPSRNPGRPLRDGPDTARPRSTRRGPATPRARRAPPGRPRSTPQVDAEEAPAEDLQVRVPLADRLVVQRQLHPRVAPDQHERLRDVPPSHLRPTPVLDHQRQRPDCPARRQKFPHRLLRHGNAPRPSVRCGPIALGVPEDALNYFRSSPRMHWSSSLLAGSRGRPGPSFAPNSMVRGLGGPGAHAPPDCPGDRPGDGLSFRGRRSSPGRGQAASEHPSSFVIHS